MSFDVCLLGFLPSLSMPEMVVFGVIAVLLFGQRLPEVARQMGKSLMELQRGMSGLKDELSVTTPRAGTTHRTSTPKPASTFNAIDDREEATAPKFEPPKSEPREASSSS